MANEISTKIAKSALTRREKSANREAVKELAAKHMEAAIRKLGDIVADKNAPASAKVAAATQLLDRVAGKPKLVDEKSTEHEFDRMSEAQLLSSICSSIAVMSQEARGTIAEALLCAQRGIVFDERMVDPDYDEARALAAERPELPHFSESRSQNVSLAGDEQLRELKSQPSGPARSGKRTLHQGKFTPLPSRRPKF